MGNISDIQVKANPASGESMVPHDMGRFLFPALK